MEAQDKVTAETIHMECNCVPTLGPPHCHMCSEVNEVETPWECCVTQTAEISEN